MRSGELYMVSKIGRYCSVGEKVIIGLEPVNHPLDWLSTHPFQYSNKKPLTSSTLDYKSEWQNVEIGVDIWIGQEAIIVKGVKIGNGAVIGARSIVTQDVPEYAIAIGITAKLIKYRFSDDVVEKLNKYPWWHLSASDLDNIFFDDVRATLVQMSEVKTGNIRF